MLYEDRLYGFAVAAMQLAPWHPSRQDGAEEAMAIAVAMEAAFSATLKARRDAAEQAAKRAREEAARAAAVPTEPLPDTCDWTAYGTPSGRPSVAVRVQRGLTRERPMCAAHDSAGESLGYWLPKVVP